MSVGSAIAQTITEFSAGLSADAEPWGITSGPDGNLWFTEQLGNRIGRITPTGVITEFSTGLSANVLPNQIVLGPDGNLWFTERSFNGGIGRITPAGVITEFSTGTNVVTGLGLGNGTEAIAVGSDGNIWFTQPFSIGRITTAGVLLQTFPLVGPPLAQMTAGPDGNIWFPGYGAIGQISPAGVITVFTAGITPDAYCEDITVGPDGNLWFTEYIPTSNLEKIGRITTTGQVTEFSIPNGTASGAALEAIATGSDGKLWFSLNANEIGSITTTGTVSEYGAGISSSPGDVTSGPDGNIWFTESAGRIGRVDLSQAPPAAQTITFGPTPTITVSGTGTISATASSGLPVTFTSLTLPVCTISGTTVAGFSAGTCTIQASQAGNSTYAPAQANLTFSISNPVGPPLTAQSITFGFPPTVAVGGMINVSATASSGLAVTFNGLTPLTCTVAGSTVTGKSVGTCTVQAIQSGNSTYSPAQATQSFAVTALPTQTISFGPAPVVVVGSSAAVTAGSSAGLPVTLSSLTPLICAVVGNTVTGLSVGTCAVLANQVGNASYGPAQATLNFVVLAVVVPQTGYWWNPAESGRGFSIEQRGSNLFMAAFLYDSSGRATWYGIGPGPIVANTYTGTLSSYLNGQTLTGTYQPPTFAGSSGSFSITFTTPTQATMTWPGGMMEVERFAFGPGGTQPAGTPQTGWWWAPAESGRGYTVEIQGDLMFFSGYMYDAQGNPIWYASGPTAMTSTALYQGVWQQYGNGQTLSGSYVPPSLVNADLGKLTIQFTSTTTGMLTFPDGRQVAIARFSF
jgi:streptogramin lyase